MDTAHLALPIDELKNLRTDVRLDDGTEVPLLVGHSYRCQNIGASEVRISERSTSRGEPDIESNDYLLLSNREWTRLDIFPDVNYIAWSRGQDSVLSVTELS